MGRALLPGLGVALGFGIAFGNLLHPGPLPLAAAGAALAVGAWRRSVTLLWWRRSSSACPWARMNPSASSRASASDDVAPCLQTDRASGPVCRAVRIGSHQKQGQEYVG